MKNSLMGIADKTLLRKWVLIEIRYDELKNIAQIEHSGIVLYNKFISAITTYCFFEKKHVIDMNFFNDGQFIMF